MSSENEGMVRTFAQVLTAGAVQPAFQTLAFAIVIITLVVTSIAGWRAGAVSVDRLAVPRSLDASDPGSTAEDSIMKPKPPFEILALSDYYSHALRRANVSFWFSIVFGTIGFGVIIFAFSTHVPSDPLGTVLKTGGGAIIDAISSIFFVQSTAAQKSMTEFFEKLRLDRLNAEARALISEIENEERRDQLRAQLVLKYAGIDKLLVG